MDSDTDGDGFPDGFEDKYRPTLNPLVANDGSLDPEGDGLTTALEYVGGTNPTVSDAHLYPPTWISVERSLRYDFDDYGLAYPTAPKKLTTTATWPGAVPTNEDPLSVMIPFADLGSIIAQRQPFPANFPPNKLSPDLEAGGEAATMPNPPCHHASLTHRRIIVKVAAATPAPREFKAILLTERTINGIAQTPTSQGATGPNQLTLEQAAQDIKVAKEIYAQAGITLSFAVTVHNIARMGIDLSDGLTIDLQGSTGTLTQEARTILDWQATPNQADVICLYVDVGEEEIYSDIVTLGGIAIADHAETTYTGSFYWDIDVSERFMGTFFVSSQRGNAGVLAHELGHVLRLLHPGDEAELYEGVSLVLAGRNVMSTPMKYDGNPYFSSKRFRQYQDERMHGSRFVADPE